MDEGFEGIPGTSSTTTDGQGNPTLADINAALIIALKNILPAADAYLMTGDAGARGIKTMVWADTIRLAREVVSDAERWS